MDCEGRKGERMIRVVHRRTRLVGLSILFSLVKFEGPVRPSSYKYQIGGYIYWSVPQGQGSAEKSLKGNGQSTRSNLLRKPCSENNKKPKPLGHSNIHKSVSSK